MSIDYSDIAKILREEIRVGVYSGSGAFPSLTKIMQRFGVSRPSAVRSIAELKRLGLVTVRKGSGTYLSKVNRTIGLAIPGTADSEFFSAIMDGLVYNCNQYGMDLVAGDVFPVAHGLRAIQAERLARHLVSIPAAGVIMQPVAYSEEAQNVNGIIADILDNARIPVVMIDYDIAPPPERSRYDLVAIDNFNAGRKVAAHLVAAGAKRICCLLYKLSADSVHARFSGVDAEVYRVTGRHVNIIEAKPDDFDVISAGLAKYRPDAIVCSNDIAALKLSKTLAKLKVRIPQDVKLAGFDDVVEAGRMNPPLTSIRQPCFELATTAFRTLLQRMKNPELPPRQILLDTSLVVRESTASRG
jgi:LacI family transcriptional regulator